MTKADIKERLEDRLAELVNELQSVLTDIEKRKSLSEDDTLSIGSALDNVDSAIDDLKGSYDY